MNAHINHDLPLAVDETCRELALLPEDDTPPHRDFVHVNEILGEVEDRVKVWFEQSVLAALDRDLGPLDDAFAMWSIRSARDLAWEHAKLLWALSDHPQDARRVPLDPHAARPVRRERHPDLDPARISSR